MDESNSKVWQATLTPHRSLNRQGFYVLMGLVILVNVIVAGIFVAMGAWPIAGFAGIDVMLVWWAFKVNFADARKLERISITEHELVLERVSEKSAPEQRRFVRRWVRVELEEDRERELIGKLLLISGRTRVAVGEFLAPEERKMLAQALKSAIAIPRI
jgi:uncharacterized membrane protein